MREYQWRDFGDGKPIRVQVCPMCGASPTNVDDCGEFGNPECPYFGIGREEYDKLNKDVEMQELLKDKSRIDWLADVDNTIGNVQLPRKIIERNLASLRDAIDEAMAYITMDKAKEERWNNRPTCCGLKVDAFDNGAFICSKCDSIYEN